MPPQQRFPLIPMAQAQKEPKERPEWEGSASAELPRATADEAWLLISDFFSLHRWLPDVETCRKVDEAEGCVRYCAGPAADTGEPAKWAMEKVLEMNERERSYSYEVTDSNMGFGWYVAKMQVAPGSGEAGCRLVWSFECDAVEGWTQVGLVEYLQTGLETIARRIEEAVKDAE